MARADRSKKPYTRPASAAAARPSADDGMWLHDKAPGTRARGPAGRGAAPAGASSGAPRTKLRVTNLQYEITPKDLLSIFGQVGTLLEEPKIKYDRSGRSTGEASITYETAAEASRAKKEFQGVLARDQPMTIDFDTTIPQQRRTASAPSSLLARLERKPLLDRLASDGSGAEKKGKAASNNGKAATDKGGVGPIRTKASGRGKPAAAEPAKRERREKKKPQTAEELDQELEAFMDDSGPGAAADAQAAPASVDAAEDAVMA